MNKPTQPTGYYYGSEADQYTFIRLPKALFSDERYKGLSDSAKILYGLMLDRMSLSVKSGWLDAQGRVFIIFTLVEVQEYLNCHHEKAVKLFAELDTVKGVGLIERIRRGLGRPSLIYVLKFAGATGGRTPGKKPSTQDDNDRSGTSEEKSPDVCFSAGTNTDLNNTDYNKTEPDRILSYPTPCNCVERQKTEPDTIRPDTAGFKDDGYMSAYETYREIIKENLGYENIIEESPYDRERIDEIVSLMLETLCSPRRDILIAGDRYPAELVKAKFLKLNSLHLEYVLETLKKNTTEIRNIKKYILATLFNAKSTIDCYYTARVAHDMACGAWTADGPP